jgi:hypothetical protein
VTCAYLDRLFSEAKIKNYLDRHHPGPLETLMTIIADMSRSGTQARMADAPQ